MKYTNYIINGDIINVESITTLTNSDIVNKSLLPAAILVASIGVVVLASVIPITLVLDGAREIKAVTVKGKRKYHTNYVISLPALHAQSQIKNAIKHKSEQLVIDKRPDNISHKIYKERSESKLIKQ